MTSRKERRQSRRVSTDLELTVAGLDEATVPARTLNLSAGGAYLVTQDQLAPLSKLELGIELPALPVEEKGGKSWVLQVDAVVVHSEPTEEAGGGFRVGVAFMNMSPEDRTRLEDYIDWRITRSLLESAESVQAE